MNVGRAIVNADNNSKAFPFSEPFNRAKIFVALLKFAQSPAVSLSM